MQVKLHPAQRGCTFFMSLPKKGELIPTDFSQDTTENQAVDTEVELSRAVEWLNHFQQQDFSPLGDEVTEDTRKVFFEHFELMAGQGQVQNPLLKKAAGCFALGVLDLELCVDLRQMGYKIDSILQVDAFKKELEKSLDRESEASGYGVSLNWFSVARVNNVKEMEDLQRVEERQQNGPQNYEELETKEDGVVKIIWEEGREDW